MWSRCIARAYSRVQGHRGSIRCRAGIPREGMRAHVKRACVSVVNAKLWQPRPGFPTVLMPPHLVVQPTVAAE